MRGFRGFRRPEVITDEALTNFLTRTGLDSKDANYYVMWTGGDYRRRLGSARSGALATLDVKGKPVKLSDWIALAARCRSSEDRVNFGFDPATVRSGLFLHQGAKPCVYLALERRPDGSFVASRDVNLPDPGLGYSTLKRGDVVIAADDGGEKAVAKMELSTDETKVVETAESKKLAAPVTTSRKGRNRR